MIRLLAEMRSKLIGTPGGVFFEACATTETLPRPAP
jgi:hypothetical protein